MNLSTAFHKKRVAKPFIKYLTGQAASVVSAHSLRSTHRQIAFAFLPIFKPLTMSPIHNGVYAICKPGAREQFATLEGPHGHVLALDSSGQPAVPEV